MFLLRIGLVVAIVFGAGTGSFAGSGSTATGTLERGEQALEAADGVAAMRLLRPLAEAGDPQTQTKIGILYQSGRGVPVDYSEAIRWFRQAADQGNVEAQNNLGLMFLYGRGVEKDLVSAHMWFDLAASGGKRSAAFTRDLVAANMTPAQVKEAHKLACEHKTDSRPQSAKACG